MVVGAARRGKVLGGVIVELVDNMVVLLLFFQPEINLQHGVN